jgi:hypothetical protein
LERADRRVRPPIVQSHRLVERCRGDGGWQAGGDGRLPTTRRVWTGGPQRPRQRATVTRSAR